MREKVVCGGKDRGRGMKFRGEVFLFENVIESEGDKL